MLDTKWMQDIDHWIKIVDGYVSQFGVFRYVYLTLHTIFPLDLQNLPTFVKMFVEEKTGANQAKME